MSAVKERPETLAEYVARRVAEAPPLTEAQKAKLRPLLSGGIS